MIISRIKSISSNKIISNTGWIIGEKVIQMVISLIIGMITARYLGPDNYGLINYGASYIAFFYSICTLGLEGIIVKQLVQNPNYEGEILGTGILMRIVSSVVSILSIIIIVSTINPNDVLLRNVVFLQSLSLIFRSFELIDYWYQSRLKSKYTTIIKSIAYIVMSIYKVIILIMQKDIIWFAFSTTLDLIVVAILMIYSYFRNNGQRLSFSFKLSKNMLSESYHFILSGLMVAVYGQMDKLMIGQMLGVKSVGLYSVGITICSLWNFIPCAIISSLRPSIIESKNISRDLYEHKIKKLYSIIIWLGILYAIFISIFSKPIILILYGKNYIGALLPLKIAVWYGIFSILGIARDIWIICEGYQKYSKYFALIGSICNFILNILLIPKFGIVGASIATLITQIITGFFVTLVFKDTRESNKYMIEGFLLKGVLKK